MILPESDTARSFLGYFVTTFPSLLKLSQYLETRLVALNRPTKFRGFFLFLI